MDFILPENESERLDALYQYQILDTHREMEFDNITELACQISGTALAYIGFIDAHRQWLKSSYHLPLEYHQGPREQSFCTRTICQSKPVIIEDLQHNELYRSHPAVVGEPGFRFYCGIPLINDEGHALGTLCVIDTKPNSLSEFQLCQLIRLSHQTLALIELNKNTLELKRLEQQQEKATQESQELLLNILPAAIANELQREEAVKPRYYDLVSIMFAHFDSLEQHRQRQPATVIESLDHLFTVFDDLTGAFSIEKIKTNGHQYLSACGLPELDRAHAIKCTLAALSMKRYLWQLNHQPGASVRYTGRFAIHSGPVIAGVVGTSKFVYDLWGDSVNISARVLDSGDDQEIRISEYSYIHCREFFECEDLGLVEVKHMPPLHMFRVHRLKLEYSYDPRGFLANERLLKLLQGY